MRLFPWMVGRDGKAWIPWSLLNDEQARANHGQTLERLAERGGLVANEAAAIIERRPWSRISDEEAWAVIWRAAEDVVT